MYHTFSTVSAETSSEASKRTVDPKERRALAVRACEPCRRRKVKCDGNLPCETCQYYRRPAQCQYNDNAQRVTPGKRTAEKATYTALHSYRNVFNKLFPNAQPEQLAELSRQQLVDRLIQDSPRFLLQPLSPSTPLSDETRPQIHPDATSLETFQPMPEDGSETSDQRPPKGLQGVQDDVNALSLSVKPTSSYLGISSVMAVLRIIVWLDPQAQAVFRRTPEGSATSSRDITSPSTPNELIGETASQAEDASTSAWNEIPHINSYFTFFHPMVPLLDEQSFRDTYITRQRSDPRWMLLLNIVLALGSAVNGNAGDHSHRLYYIRAKRYLTLEAFGLVHLETVQALALLSGYYLHYLQLPNQANSVMGATLRMATALGLHRDYSESVAMSQKKHIVSLAEIRRRIWWCIVCLDSWASISLGRPSMGRVGHAHTVKIPTQPIGNSTQILTLLQENVQFALISTRQEDTLAYSPFPNESDRKALDSAYTDWFKNSSVHDDTPRPSITEHIGISVMKSIMRWRYIWCRIVLHRPVLLWNAMRQLPVSKLEPERQATIELCHDLTSELINDIAMTWAGRNRCIMSAWHATWLLYQATMVPLLALFLDTTDVNIKEKSHVQIQLAMKVLSDHIDYAHTAKRSLEVVSLIYEAGKKHQPRPSSGITASQTNKVAIPTQASHTAFQTQQSDSIATAFDNQLVLAQDLDTPHQELLMDNMFDSLNWSTGWMDGSEDWIDFNGLDFSTGDSGHNDTRMEPFTFESEPFVYMSGNNHRPQMDLE